MRFGWLWVEGRLVVLGLGLGLGLGLLKLLLTEPNAHLDFLLQGVTENTNVSDLCRPSSEYTGE